LANCWSFLFQINLQVNLNLFEIKNPFCLQQKGFIRRGDLILRGGLPVAVRYTNFSSFNSYRLAGLLCDPDLGSITNKSLSSFGKLLVFFISNKFPGKPEFI
jgi:hypothetical protein